LEEYLAVGDTTAAFQLLQDINTKEAKRLLSSEYIARNQMTLAESILNNLSRETQEDEIFTDFKTY
jgi:thioredoxin-like negative regulator of GroEL